VSGGARRTNDSIAAAARLIVGIAAALALAAIGCRAEAATLTVGGSGADFPTIQAAVDAAPEGSTIEVRAGVYREHVEVRTRLTLSGEAGAVVDAGKKGSAVTLVGSGITLTGLEVRNAGSAENNAGLLVLGDGNTIARIHATGNNSGIVILLGRDNTISDSDVSGNKHDGIVIIGATASAITNNVVAKNGRAGIWLEGYHGKDALIEATENRITGNQVHDNVSFGIALNTGANRNEVSDNVVTANGSAAPEAGILINCGPNKNLVQRNKLSANQKHGILVISGSAANRFLFNEVTGSATGIGVYDGSANEFASNRVSDSAAFGIHLDDLEPLTGNSVKLPGFPSGAYPASSLNVLYDNDLFANRVNAFDRSGKPWEPAGVAALSAEMRANIQKALGPNQWDNGTEGNHYDDFDEPSEGFIDNNGDGIGDVAHPIPGGVAVDHFPLARAPKTGS
jgi:parallel beta-helix repeat protein